MAVDGPNRTHIRIYKLKKRGRKAEKRKKRKIYILYRSSFIDSYRALPVGVERDSGGGGGEDDLVSPFGVIGIGLSFSFSLSLDPFPSFRVSFSSYISSGVLK